MDFAQLRWRTEKLSGRTSPDLASDTSPLDIYEAVNDAYLELVGSDEWSFLYDRLEVTTIADVDTYTMPWPVRTVGHVELDGEHLRPRGVHSPKPVGAPVGEYELVGMLDIRLRPAPTEAGTLVLHGWHQPEPLDQDSDVPVLPPEFHRTIAYLAAISLLGQDPTVDGDDPRKDLYGQIVFGDIERMKRLAQRSHDRTVSKIGQRRVRS